MLSPFAIPFEMQPCVMDRGVTSNGQEVQPCVMDRDMAFYEQEISRINRRCDWLADKKTRLLKKCGDQAKELEEKDAKIRRISQKLEGARDFSDNQKSRAEELQTRLELLQAQNSTIRKDLVKEKHERFIAERNEAACRGRVLSLDRNVNSLVDQVNSKENTIRTLLDRVESMENTIRSYQRGTSSDGPFVESTLKLRFLFDKVEQCSAIREDHKDWVFDAVEDVKIPDVPRMIREKYLPCEQDAGIDFSGDDGERIEEWSREAHEHSLLIDRMGGVDSIIRCQSIVRRFIAVRRANTLRKLSGFSLTRILRIQKVFRGYLNRGYSSYCIDDLPTRFAPNRGANVRRPIGFINTGGDSFKVSWVRDPHRSSRVINADRAGDTIMAHRINPYNISTFPGHMFHIYNLKDNSQWVVRIPLNFTRRATGLVYDLNTKVSIHRWVWHNTNKERFIAPDNGMRPAFINTPLTNEPEWLRHIHECGCAACMDRLDEITEEQQMHDARIESMQDFCELSLDFEDHGDALASMFD